MLPRFFAGLLGLFVAFALLAPAPDASAQSYAASRARLWRTPTPSLALDFTLAFDGRISFSRGGHATQYDSAGNLIYAPHNICAQSQNLLGGAGWFGNQVTVTDSGVAGLFGVNFVQVQTSAASPTDPYYRQQANTSAGFRPGAYVAQTWYVKRGNVSSVTLRAIGAGGGPTLDVQSFYNFDTDTLTPNGAASFTRTLLPNGIVRLRQVIKTDPANTFYEGRIRANSGSLVQGDTVLAADPQYELVLDPNATPLPYISTGSGAAIYKPRFDYDQVTLAPRGLEIEEQRTNSDRNSTMQGAAAGTPGTAPNFWNISGSGGGITRTIAGPTMQNGFACLDVQYVGTATSASNDNFDFETSTSAAAANGQTWTQSVSLQLMAGSIPSGAVILRTIFADSGGVPLTFSTTNIVITGTRTRFFDTLTAANASTAFVYPRVSIGFANGEQVNYTLRICSPQLEQGAFATSTIPTYGSAATRSADVATMPVGPWFNPNAGTLYAQFIYTGQPASGFARLVGLGGSSVDTDEIAIYTGQVAATYSGVITTGAVDAFSGGSAQALNAGTVQRGALAWGGGKMMFAAQGLARADTAYAIALPTITQLVFMGRLRFQLLPSGWLQRVRYLPQKLPSSPLQAITR